MKKVYLFAVIAISCMGVKAFAVDANSSWDQILADTSLKAVSTSPAFGTCLEADGQTLNGGLMPVCDQWSRPDGRGKYCTHYTEKLNEFAVNYIAQVCVDWESAGRGRSYCAKYQSEPASVALTFNVDVYDNTGKHIDQGYPLFTKEYTVPACAK